MAVIRRWAWLVGLSGAVLGVGAVLGLAMNGAASSGARNLAGLAVLFGGAFVALRRDDVLAWVRSEATLRRFATGLATTLALAVSVASVSLATRHDRTLDLTRGSRHTLSDQAIRVLEGLSTDVTVTAFATPLTPGRDANARLLERAREHNALLSIDFVDPIASPSRARAAGVTGEHSIVFVRAPGRPPVRIDGPISETDLVSALVEATSEVLHRVCWTIDHGEADPDDETSPDGLGGVRTALERLNYQVTLTRLVAQGIEDRCEVVVVARPVLELSPASLAALDAYVLGGGQLFVMIEPGASPALSEWLARFGIDARPESLADPQASFQVAGADPSALWIPSPQTHPIVADLDGFAFVGARAVDPLYEASGVEVSGIVWTSDLAVRVAGPDQYVNTPRAYALVTVARVDDPRAVGPLTAEAPPLPLRAGGRLVVVGDADFATARGAQLANNTDLFLNAIAWLVREPAQVGARAAPAETLRLSEGGLTVQAVLFVALWPGLAVAGAGIVLWRRRSQDR